jgi:hypothetical protein
MKICSISVIMKTKPLLFGSLLIAVSALSQGTINLPPVAVTNGVTGVLADSSILAAIYYGPSGAPDSTLLMLAAPSALVGGYARFGNGVVLPYGIGATAEVQVRAWSAPFMSYESAVASELASVLAGKSAALEMILGGSPTPAPVPDPLLVPGFTIYPAPEPSLSGLVAVGGGMLALTRLRLSPATR